MMLNVVLCYSSICYEYFLMVCVWDMDDICEGVCGRIYLEFVLERDLNYVLF